MKTKLGNTDPAPAFAVHAIFAIGEIVRVMVAGACANMERRAALCLGTEEDQYQHLL
jgi:hypothetical protein